MMTFAVAVSVIMGAVWFGVAAAGLVLLVAGVLEGRR